MMTKMTGTATWVDDKYEYEGTATEVRLEKSRLIIVCSQYNCKYDVELDLQAIGTFAGNWTCEYQGKNYSGPANGKLYLLVDSKEEYYFVGDWKEGGIWSEWSMKLQVVKSFTRESK